MLYCFEGDFVSQKTNQAIVVMKRRRVSALTGLTLLAIFGMAIGAVTVWLFPLIFNSILAQQLTIVEGTPSYYEWSASSVPVINKMYLFSIQNPDEFLAGTEKPKLLEMGPYAFRESSKKVNVTFNDNNFTVTYSEQNFWNFVPDESVGSLSDLVTTVNLPVLASAFAAKGNFLFQWGLSSTLESIGSEVFITRTVGELLFDGYEDTLLAFADWFSEDSAIPMDKFGWFYKRNGTSWADGTFNMFTGQDDIQKLGRIHSWNDQKQTNFPDECGRVHGSAGGFYPPGTKSKSLDLFSHEACRTLSFHMKYHDQLEGIPTGVYKLDETTFANASTYPPNACFNNNLPSGVQNSTQCKQNSPAFLSFPHFYLADPFYVDQFEDGSLLPHPDNHESRIRLEPTMGIPLEVLMRLQINIRLDPIEGITILQDLPSAFYMPVLWFEAQAKITPSVARSLKTILNMPRIVRIVGLVFVGLGLCFVITSVFIRCKRSHDVLLQVEEDELKQKHGEEKSLMVREETKA